jgi:multimeric flavodoxin WrbA
MHRQTRGGLIMNVLGFVGSPRKQGNTDILADTFLEGAASGGAEVKKFFLAEHTINQCRGCYRKCILKPGIRCGTFRDDMDMILKEMVSSDLMLFASPYYCASYTAIMARFLERCLPLWEVEIAGEMGTMEAFRFINAPLKGKKAVIGLVQDFKDPLTAQLAIKAFQHTLGKTYMMHIIKKIHVTDVRDVGDIRKKKDVIQNIFALGRKLARTQP